MRAYCVPVVNTDQECPARHILVKLLDFKGKEKIIWASK